MITNRINYTCTKEEMEAITQLIDDNPVAISPTAALRHFVKLGIDAWRKQSAKHKGQQK